MLYSSSLVVFNSTFLNTSAQTGGAVLSFNGSSAVLQGCDLTEGSAVVGGGATAVTNSTLTLIESTVEDCVASGGQFMAAGGGVAVFDFSVGDFLATGFTGNSAPQRAGGCIFGWSNSQLSAQGCSFSGCSAEILGGGILASGVVLTVVVRPSHASVLILF